MVILSLNPSYMLSTQLTAELTALDSLLAMLDKTLLFVDVVGAVVDVAAFPPAACDPFVVFVVEGVFGVVLVLVVGVRAIGVTGRDPNVLAGSPGDGGGVYRPDCGTVGFSEGLPVGVVGGVRVPAGAFDMSVEDA